MKTEFEKRLEAIEKDALPDDREATKRYWYLCEMQYRTMGCYREDGSVMSDAEYVEKFEENFMALEAFLTQERQRKLNPFGNVDEHREETRSGDRKRSDGGHHDFSDR